MRALGRDAHCAIVATAMAALTLACCGAQLVHLRATQRDTTLWPELGARRLDRLMGAGGERDASLLAEHLAAQHKGAREPLLSAAGLASSYYNALPATATFVNSGHNINGADPYDPATLAAIDTALHGDLFGCVDPSLGLYRTFTNQYNRSVSPGTAESALDAASGGDPISDVHFRQLKSERYAMFEVTLKRAMVLNRIVQDEALNVTRHPAAKAQAIANQYFVAPASGPNNVALWYADINECELGVIKKIVFDIVHFLDTDRPEMAYERAIQNSEYLPLLNVHAFEQAANILLVRLFDRFEADTLINALFKWPLYVKRLAAHAYSRRQAAAPDFAERLALVSFAYPAYFRDVKYNAPALNRTSDNWQAFEAFETFNARFGRKFRDSADKNRRLAVWRQAWSKVALLNEQLAQSNGSQLIGAPHLAIEQDYTSAADSTYSQRTHATGSQDSSHGEPSRLAALIDPDSASGTGSAARLELASAKAPYLADLLLREPVAGSRSYAYTRFSHLTDAEFVAYLTNDYSLLDKRSAEFLDADFSPLPLDKSLRDELAAELELRRTTFKSAKPGAAIAESSTGVRASFALARKVIDELISDVGLPIGPTSAANTNDTSEDAIRHAFVQVARHFDKTYARRSSSQRNAPSDSELADERALRLNQFAQNYPKFRAWFTKAGWQLSERQQVSMLRLADMSWLELKLAVFKVCCLTEVNLAALSAQNATIHYLGSHDFLCRPMAGATSGASVADSEAWSALYGGAPSASDTQANELAALELYYYYTVHFNKHHLDMSAFGRRFAVFRQNIDHIRHQSCSRALTLFRALKHRNTDALNTIDSLDAKRVYTDDINLDRFVYFEIPAPDAAPSAKLAADNGRVWPWHNSASGSSSSSSRAQISYRREPFELIYSHQGAGLASTSTSSGQLINPPSFPGLMAADARDVQLQATRYSQNAAWRVYELVAQRYRHCFRLTNRYEASEAQVNNVRQCRPEGALADWAAADRNYLSDSSRRQVMRAQQLEDSCVFYKFGLDPYGEGLIKQDAASAQLISGAKC